MEENHIDRCVCFSCGNASRAIKEAGIPCVEISPGGDFECEPLVEHERDTQHLPRFLRCNQRTPAHGYDEPAGSGIQNDFFRHHQEGTDLHHTDRKR